MKTVKVYVLLYWYWDGDSNLTDTYKGVFATQSEAERKVIYENDGRVTISVYYPGDKLPEESDGHYRSAPFWEIREELIKIV